MPDVLPVKQKKPIFDFGTPEEVQKAYLAIFGLFVMIPASIGGFLLTGWFVYPGLALAGGISAAMIVGGLLGFFTVVIRQAVQQVTIKVIKEE